MKYYKDDRRRNYSTKFFIGLVLLIIGLFIFSKKVYIHNSWLGLRIGSLDLSGGLVTLPLIFGIVWQFYDPRSSFAKLLMLAGGVILIISIIMSIRISFVGTSLFDYLLMFALIGAGTGIVLKELS